MIPTGEDCSFASVQLGICYSRRPQDVWHNLVRAFDKNIEGYPFKYTSRRS